MDKKESFVHNQSASAECSNNYDYQHPDFKVHLARKFELSELCEIFFNKWGKYLYLITVTLVSLLFAWSLATVVGSALATNIPLNFGPFQQCPHDAFNNRVIPHGPGLEGCQLAYYFCLMLFALVVIPLTLMDLNEQAILQMVFGLLRVLLISMLLIYCIVNLMHGGNIYELKENILADNASTPTNASERCYLELYDIVVNFDWRWWLTIIPAMMYTFMVQHTIPTLTHPIKEKKYLGWVVMCSFTFVMLCYLTLGVVLPLWFGGETQGTLSLSWVSCNYVTEFLHYMICEVQCLKQAFLERSMN